MSNHSPFSPLLGPHIRLWIEIIILFPMLNVQPLPILTPIRPTYSPLDRKQLFYFPCAMTNHSPFSPLLGPHIRLRIEIIIILFSMPNVQPVILIPLRPKYSPQDRNDNYFICRAQCPDTQEIPHVWGHTPHTTHACILDQVPRSLVYTTNLSSQSEAGCKPLTTR